MSGHCISVEHTLVSTAKHYFSIAQGERNDQLFPNAGSCGKHCDMPSREEKSRTGEVLFSGSDMLFAAFLNGGVPWPVPDQAGILCVII